MKHLTVFLMSFVMLIFLGCSASKKNPQKEQAENSSLNYQGAYTLVDAQFGTKTSMEINDSHRIMQTNALPNHSTGKFPNAGNPNKIRAQNLRYEFPLKPQFSGQSKWAREPGVAVNGVKFEPETAERFVCTSGEVYKIEAIQDLLNLGLDHNLAHVQPTGAYHYHGVPHDLIQQLDQGEDLILVGFAKDGFPMYYSKSGKYKPGYVLSEDLRTGDFCEYQTPKVSMKENFNRTRPDGTFVSDWTFVATAGQLDECNGIELNGEYVYFITDEYPYVGRCLKGEFEERRPRRPPGEHPHRPRRRPPGGE